MERLFIPRKTKKFCLLLVHDVFGYWTLSKGKVEASEDIVEGTKKAIKKKLDWISRLKKSLEKMSMLLVIRKKEKL